MDFAGKVKRIIERFDMLPPGPVVVGVSGGADSVALLHVLLGLRSDLELAIVVAHLNHGIRGEEADLDAAFVENLARVWDLPAVVEVADVPKIAGESGLALEEAARQARYGFLLRVAREVAAGAVAVAHHADDQAETVLMHFLRGTGLAGLRGILPVSDLARFRLGTSAEVAGSPVRLVRPLLEVTKQEILEYCTDNSLEFRFDRSNLDLTYFRNRLRHELLPTLETYNPNVREVLRRTAIVTSDDYAFLQSRLHRAWARVLISCGDEWFEFDLERWRRLPGSLQRGTLREAVRRLRWGLRNINWVHIENALGVLSEKGTGASATLPQGLAATIRYDRFYVAEAAWTPPALVPQLDSAAVSIPVRGRVVLPGGRWAVETEVLDSPPSEALENQDLWQAWLDLSVAGSDLALRPRKPGDAFAPLGMGGHVKRVNELMINAKVVREWRANWPLLANAHQVLWIVGLQVDDRAAIASSTRQVLHVRLNPLCEAEQGKA